MAATSDREDRTISMESGTGSGKRGAGEAPRSRRNVAMVFVALMVAMFVGSLDQTIMGTALPTIVGDLGGADHMMWVTSAYLLCSTITMPIYGKLGDMVGRKGLFCLSWVLFLAGSAVSACATNMAMLIAGRAIQGMGGGGSMVLSQAIVADIFPPNVRGKYMGVMGAAFGASAVLGPLLGGWFTDYIGWRWCFLVNIPLGMFSLAVAAACLQGRGAGLRGLVRSGRTVDGLGIVAMAGASACIVLALSWGGNLYAWSDPLIVGPIGAAVAFAGAFVLVERRAADPLIPLRFFRNRNFCLATLSGLLLMAGMMGVLSYLPTMLQGSRGLGATASGYLMVPLMLGNMVMGTIAGFAVGKVSSAKVLPVASCAVTAVAYALLAAITTDTSLVALCAELCLLGAGVGLGQQIYVLIVQNEFPIEEVGTATSANNFFREIGATVGSTVVGSVFTANLLGNLGTYTASEGGLESAGITAEGITPAAVRGLGEPLRSLVEAAYNDAIVPILAVLAGVMVLSGVLSACMRSTKLASTNEESGHMG